MNRKTIALASFYVLPVIDKAEELIRLSKRNTLIFELTELENRISKFSENKEMRNLIEKIQRAKEIAKENDFKTIDDIKNNERRLSKVFVSIYSDILISSEEITILYEGRSYDREVFVIPRIGEQIEIIDMIFARVISVEHHLDNSIIVSCSSRPKVTDFVTAPN